MSLLKFRVREVTRGGCVQYSYQDEIEFITQASTSRELRAQLEAKYGPIVDSDKIVNGTWIGGIVLKCDKTWLRVKRAA